MPEYEYEGQKAQLVKEVEDYRTQANMQRQRLSTSLKEMISFCQMNMQQDPLIFPRKENNPFKEKRTCTIL